MAATANVWPTVDRGALTRAFATLKSQGLNFRTCSITVNDARAVANCRGTVQFVRKVGNSIPLTSEQLWVFKSPLRRGLEDRRGFRVSRARCRRAAGPGPRVKAGVFEKQPLVCSSGACMAPRGEVSIYRGDRVAFFRRVNRSHEPRAER